MRIKLSLLKKSRSGSLRRYNLNSAIRKFQINSFGPPNKLDQGCNRSGIMIICKKRYYVQVN